MIKMSLMTPSKETDNKLRWVAYIDGVAFHLYIPKWRVPDPWPKSVRVLISRPSDSAAYRSGPSIEPENPISVIVERVADHTQTVRFAPIGDPQEWQIGEPYIPFSLLPDPSVRRLRVDVEWDWATGTWDG